MKQPRKIESQQFDVYARCKRELQRMKREGSFTGEPGEWHPAAILARMTVDPAIPASLKFLAAKELLPFVSSPMPKSVQIEGDAPQITVLIAPFAATTPVAVEAAIDAHPDPGEPGAIVHSPPYRRLSTDDAKFAVPLDGQVRVVKRLLGEQPPSVTGESRE